MDESKILGVSVRGWITVLTVMTVCVMSYLAKDVKEPLYSLVLLASGFYFGSKTKGENVQVTSTKTTE